MFKLLNGAVTVNSIGQPKGTTDCSTRELLEKVEQSTQEPVNKLKAKQKAVNTGLRKAHF